MDQGLSLDACIGQHASCRVSRRPETPLTTRHRHDAMSRERTCRSAALQPSRRQAQAQSTPPPSHKNAPRRLPSCNGTLTWR